MGGSVQEGVHEGQGQQLAPPNHAHADFELVIFVCGEASVLRQYAHLERTRTSSACTRHMVSLGEIGHLDRWTSRGLKYVLTLLDPTRMGTSWAQEGMGHMPRCRPASSRRREAMTRACRWRMAMPPFRKEIT